MAHLSLKSLNNLILDQIWIQEYPVKYSGIEFYARMTIVKLSNGQLWIHSPAPVDTETLLKIKELGEVGFIVAPGTFHYFYVTQWQEAFPQAKTILCPGIEKKKPEIPFNFILGNDPQPEWVDDFDQVVIQGSSIIWEVPFFHKKTKTLILVDLIENIGKDTPDVDWKMKIWWKLVFHMWDHPKPAPEYQLGYHEKKAVKRTLEKVMSWDFDKIILAHGELISGNAKEIAQKAWERPLGFKS